MQTIIRPCKVVTFSFVLNVYSLIAQFLVTLRIFERTRKIVRLGEYTGIRVRKGLNKLSANYEPYKDG